MVAHANQARSAGVFSLPFTMITILQMGIKDWRRKMNWNPTFSSFVLGIVALMVGAVESNGKPLTICNNRN